MRRINKLSQKENITGFRLQVYMSRCGAGSRRQCEKYIEQGRVRINGRKAFIGEKVCAEDHITLDDIRLKFQEKLVYISVNKPSGYLCSNSDTRGRPLVSDLFKNKQRLFHVGRLDFLSTGLIFYTNDGHFAYIVSHPGYCIEKVYLVTTKEPIPDTILLQYRDGIKIQGETFRMIRYTRKTSREVHLTLNEGKNREIRKVFSALSVVRIHRTNIGCVSIKGILTGDYRHLTQDEVNWFLKKGE